LLTPYGSDIFWYQSYPKHLKKIKRLLELADGFSSECRRDELLAIRYGFQGIFLPRIPAFGSISISKPDSNRSFRKSIAVKGYQNKWGQAVMSLRALERVASQLNGMTVEIFSAEGATLRAAKKLRETTGISVIIYRKHELTNMQVLELFSRSQIFIGLSKSDGISASMIEAMSQGAIPIQSITSCCDEWLDNGVGGYLVRYDDLDQIAAAIEDVFHDKSFQISAAQHNYDSLMSKLSETETKFRATQTYLLLDEA
jgi:glycosyltransferase involved in cell wall biosynthesis